MTELDLRKRTGLPEALRVLLADYPRESWQGHPNFSGLTAFWLERHLGFRRLIARIREETRSVLQDETAAQAFGTNLNLTAGMFVGELHLHHNVEDAHYFPQLAGLDARLTRGFALLDADHVVLSGELDRFTEDTQALLRALHAGPADKDALNRYQDRMTALERLLDRHLVDEEELVVPVILEHLGSHERTRT